MSIIAGNKNCYVEPFRRLSGSVLQCRPVWAERFFLSMTNEEMQRARDFIVEQNKRSTSSAVELTKGGLKLKCVSGRCSDE